MTVAERINNCYTRVYISQHYEEWDPRILEKYDLSKVIETIDLVDPDVFYATVRTHNGKWFCEAGLGKMHRGLKGIDQLQAIIDYRRSKNKLIFGYLSTIYDKELYDLHPEWRQVDPQGRPVSDKRGSFGKVLCPNSPYREYLVDMIKRTLQIYHIDGFYFDMIFFEENLCYCENCRRSFRSMYDADLPTEEDWDNPLFRSFIRFRNQTNYLFVKEICDAVKQVNPEVLTLIQYVMLKGRSISGQTLAVGSVPDYLYTDIYFRQGYLPMSVCTKLLVDLSKYRPEVGIMTRPGTHNDTPNMKTLDHLRSEAFTAIANGGSVMFFDIMWPDGTLQKAMWKRIAQINSEIKKREPWLGGKSVASVAVFYSENTRIWYGRSDMKNRYEANFFGVCRALIEEHIPFRLITSLEAKSLADYQVLVLPNTVCMSEKEVAAVRDYVNKGGGLVCTEKTSLWDEDGTVCADYQLGDVLGVSHLGDTATYSRVYSKFDVRQPIAKRLPSDGFVTSWGPLQKVALKGARALASIVFPYTESNSTMFVNIMANPPAVPSNWPACTLNQFGKGAVVYFAGAIDKDYLKLSFPELKWLIADAVRFVAQKPLSIHLKAPMSVEITAFRRNNGSQLVIHLVNYQLETGKTLISRDFESRHLVQEIIPVHDLELTLRVDGEVKKVCLQPENIALSFQKKKDEIKIAIPGLKCHSMVIVDF